MNARKQRHWHSNNMSSWQRKTLVTSLIPLSFPSITGFQSYLSRPFTLGRFVPPIIDYILTIALYTQRLCIIGKGSSFFHLCSHCTKQLRREAAPVCQFIQHSGTTLHIIAFRQCPPVHLMYSLAVYNHIDAVIMCCEWGPDPPCIVESDKVTLFALNDVITTWSP